ncbi:hypothetical protein F1544_14850, partial [Kineosporiaceae bacterium B12]
MSTEPVDLPDPALMWSRWAAFSAALACLGVRDVWWIDEAGAHLDDHGGSAAHLVLGEDGGALCYGWDRDGSDTGDHSPPIDLCAGAPDWAPFEHLGALAAQELLGWVVWFAPGTGWRRVGYPAGVDDGRAGLLGLVGGDRRALSELLQVQTDWAGYDPADEAGVAALTAAGERFLASAARGSVDSAALQGLFAARGDGAPAVDVAAGLAVAARAGLVAGT